jgi:hypothetical protein
MRRIVDPDTSSVSSPTALSPAGLKALRDLFKFDLERPIAAAVHKAYGLTAEDLDRLRATQPPRMPPGW